LNVPKKDLTRKETSVRLRPGPQEGVRIQYRLKAKGISFVGIGLFLKTSPTLIHYVVFGRRRSARVEAEIARLLGAADWNEVVLEARSAVTGKPVKTLVKEFSRQQAERDKAALERISAGLSAELASRKRRAG
jgi:hypothetical protein